MSLQDKINFLKNLEQQNITVEEYHAKRLVATFEQEEQLRNLLIEVYNNELLDGITENYECLYLGQETKMSYTTINQVVRGNIKRLNKELDFTIYFDEDVDAPHVPYIKCEFSDFVMVDQLVRIFCEKLMFSNFYSASEHNVFQPCPFLKDTVYYEIKHTAEQVGGEVQVKEDRLVINLPNSEDEQYIEIFEPNDEGYRCVYSVIDGYGYPLGDPEDNTDCIILQEVLKELKTGTHALKQVRF